MPTSKQVLGSVDPIDMKLGKLLRLARKSCGMSQGEVGAMNGLTFQQIQKYENGQNRISVSRLMHLAESLGVPAAWFIERLNDETSTKETTLEFNLENLGCREIQDVLHGYANIADKEQRRALRLMMTLMTPQPIGGVNDQK